MCECLSCSVLPIIAPCLIIPTTTERECKQGAVATGGGPSGDLRPLADASESANQYDLGIEIGAWHLHINFNIIIINYNDSRGQEAQ